MRQFHSTDIPVFAWLSACFAIAGACLDPPQPVLWSLAVVCIAQCIWDVRSLPLLATLCTSLVYAHSNATYFAKVMAGAAFAAICLSYETEMSDNIAKQPNSAAKTQTPQPSTVPEACNVLNPAASDPDTVAI